MDAVEDSSGDIVEVVEDKENCGKNVPMKHCRRGKRVPRGKRVIITPNDDSTRSYLSRSRVLATGYKKRIQNLLTNNKLLAKALEQSNQMVQLLENKLAQISGEQNWQNLISMKAHRLLTISTGMAALQKEYVENVKHIINLTKVSSGEDTCDLQPTQTINAQVLDAYGRKPTSPFPMDYLYGKNIFQHPSQMRSTDMTSIEEISVVNEDSSMKLPPILFADEDAAETEVPSRTPRSRSRPISSKRETQRSSARRQSSLITSKPKTPTSNVGSPFSETPKTPPIHYATGKFRSNIPVPVIKMDATKTETASPQRSFATLGNARPNSNSSSAVSKQKTVPLGSVPSNKDIGICSKKPPICLNSNSISNKEGNVSTKRPTTISKMNNKNTAAGKKSLKQKAEENFSSDINSVLDNNEESDLNLRRCTFTVTKEQRMHTSDKNEEDPFIEEIIQTGKASRLTYVKEPSKNTIAGEKAPIPTTSTTSIHTETQCAVEQVDQCAPMALPNVTILVPVDMSLTEVLPKEIHCSVVPEKPAVHCIQPSVSSGPTSQGALPNPAEVQRNSGGNTQCAVRANSENRQPQDEGTTDKPLNNNIVLDKPLSQRNSSENVVNSNPLNKKATSDSPEAELENEILPRKVSLRRKCSKKISNEESGLVKNDPQDEFLSSFKINEKADVDGHNGSPDKAAAQKVKGPDPCHKPSLKRSSIFTKKIPHLDIKKSSFLTLGRFQNKSITKLEAAAAPVQPEMAVYDFNSMENNDDSLENKILNPKVENKRISRKTQPKVLSKKRQSSDDDDDDSDFQPNFKRRYKKKTRCIVSFVNSDGEPANVSLRKENGVGENKIAQQVGSNSVPKDDGKMVEQLVSDEAFSGQSSSAETSNAKHRNRKRKVQTENAEEVALQNLLSKQNIESPKKNCDDKEVQDVESLNDQITALQDAEGFSGKKKSPKEKTKRGPRLKVKVSADRQRSRNKKPRPVAHKNAVSGSKISLDRDADIGRLEEATDEVNGPEISLPNKKKAKKTTHSTSDAQEHENPSTSRDAVQPDVENKPEMNSGPPENLILDEVVTDSNRESVMTDRWPSIGDSRFSIDPAQGDCMDVRSRRSRKPVSYKELKMNAKLRRP